MTDVPHASSDPNAGLPAADQSAIRKVEMEQAQAFVTEFGDPFAGVGAGQKVTGGGYRIQLLPGADRSPAGPM